jgi:hypothetical protein
MKFINIFLEVKIVILLPLEGLKYIIKLEDSEPLYGPIYNLLE